MPTQSIDLKFTLTDLEPKIVKFRRGGSGSNNRLTFNLLKADGTAIAPLIASDELHVQFSDFRKAIYVDAKLTFSVGATTAYYDPPQSQFAFPIMLFVRVYRVYTDNTTEPTEELLFEVV